MSTISYNTSSKPEPNNSYKIGASYPEKKPGNKVYQSKSNYQTTTDKSNLKPNNSYKIGPSYPEKRPDKAVYQSKLNYQTITHKPVSSINWEAKYLNLKKKYDDVVCILDDVSMKFDGVDEFCNKCDKCKTYHYDDELRDDNDEKLCDTCS